MGQVKTKGKNKSNVNYKGNDEIQGTFPFGCAQGQDDTICRRLRGDDEFRMS